MRFYIVCRKKEEECLKTPSKVKGNIIKIIKEEGGVFLKYRSDLQKLSKELGKEIGGELDKETGEKVGCACCYVIDTSACRFDFGSNNGNSNLYSRLTDYCLTGLGNNEFFHKKTTGIDLYFKFVRLLFSPIKKQ